MRMFCLVVVSAIAVLAMSFPAVACGYGGVQAAPALVPVPALSCPVVAAPVLAAPVYAAPAVAPSYSYGYSVQRSFASYAPAYQPAFAPGYGYGGAPVVRQRSFAGGVYGGGIGAAFAPAYGVSAGGSLVVRQRSFVAAPVVAPPVSSRTVIRQRTVIRGR